MTKEIELTQGYVALVDDEDYELVSQFKWCAQRIGERLVYAVTSVRRGRRRTALQMHRLIARPPSGIAIDHANHDGLDNRRANLRVCTRSQNCANRVAPCNNKSGFKGVSWYKRDGRWRACITIDGKNKHLGCFDAPEMAALAYNEVAAGHFGQFACLNDVHTLA